MECRCYRGDKGRTKLVKLTYRPLDFVYMAFFMIFLTVLILSRIIPYDYPITNLVYSVVFYRI
jgi:energy-coupling factor transporter transmembrane protein EcfT